jgi:Fic-DOC domain mobile mystery protein B
MSDGKTTPDGGTPGDDISGLIIKSLTDRRARDAVELEAIDLAYDKYVYKARKKTGAEWLTDDFIRRVHSDMFGKIWDWSGKYRTSNTNIGVEFYLIPEHVKHLCEDFKYWNSSSSMPSLEVAARLQNRLTRIHPFRNGNGRHARLMTDIYLKSVGQRLPQWPQVQLISEGDKIRERYTAAMRVADQGDFSELMSLIKEWQGS